MRESNNMSGWCALHVIVYVTAIAVSVGALFSYRSMITTVNSDIEKCILYAKPKVHINQKTSVCEIDFATSEWGDDSLCNFVFFTILASLVYGLIAVWFFTLCASSSRGTLHDAGVGQARSIVCPASVLSGIMGLLILIMGWEVTAGLNTFFRELEYKGQQNCTTKTGSITWDPDSAANFFRKRYSLEATVWIMVVSWLLATLLLCGRCCAGADFDRDAEYCVVKEDDSGSTFLESSERPT
ncbi:uncharacterized protein LOC135401690 isoform X1 [Ornithodoros turicata]|uniref:uncharacterized protein LOC135401690 isoform X1 n=1 Tax=Ornithodoros turicata TaxID=34597 RepID=UPI00313910E1